MTSYRIWIPSKQKYIRMFELNCEQYRNILKILDEDEEFDFFLNEILINNFYKCDYKLSDFTILDKFVIFLQLKIRSCGEKLSLTRVCDKCGEKTNINIDLNDTINKLAPFIDKKFEKSFDFQNIKIICDIPSLKENDNNDFLKTDFNRKLDFYLYSFFKTLKIKDQIISLNDFEEKEKFQICDSIPFSLMNYIRENYLNTINSDLLNVIFLDNVCKNQSCQSKFSVNLDVNNINDIIRILFSDDSPLNVLVKYANLSSNYHFDYNFYKNISPNELKIMNKMLENSNKNPENEQPKEMDFFEQYRNQTKDMKETPSEFF
jgi:hypothetical protein